MGAKKGLLYKIRRKLQVVAYHLTSAKFVSKIYFRKVVGYKLNLKNPTTLNEKIQWLKLYVFPKDKKVIQCADKYAVREYLEKHDCAQYLNDLYFVFDKVEDVEWDKLPEQFAMKCTHGCAYNIIVDDRSKLDIERAKKSLKKWMKEDFGAIYAEPHYSGIKPKIICERFLGGNMVDYKLFCCNGKYKFMYIIERSNGLKATFFDENGRKATYRRMDCAPFDDAKIPTCFEKMKTLSEKLSKDFPFVRVDWFEVNGQLYFSELTFTPTGGLIKFDSYETDRMLGNMLDIESLVKDDEKA